MYAPRSRRLFGIATALFTSIAATHALGAQQKEAAVPNVSAIGCVAQLPDTAAAPPTGHEQGAAKGLTLTRATLKSPDGRAVGDPPRSAVPGSAPTGAGSGTTDAAPARSPLAVEQAFWLVGAKSAELTRFVGRRVELTGAIEERLASNPGTAGGVTDAGASAARRSPTAPPEAPAVAHPSAPSRSISVVTFRVLDERCP